MSRYRQGISALLSTLLLGTASIEGVTVALDFGGANFSDDFTNVGNPTAGQIRWNNIARDSSRPAGAQSRIDLVVTVASGSSYTPGGGPSNLQGNGTNGVPLGATRLKVEVGTNVSFDFNFFYGNGDVASVTTSFAFLDFDSTTRSSDGVTVTENLTFLGINPSDSASYTATTTNALNVDNTNPDQPIFSSTLQGGQPDNPTDLSALTTDQEDKIIQFNVVEATGFSLNLDVGGTPPASDPDSARTFFISDAITFNQTTDTTVIPEPSSSLLLGLGSLLLTRRRRA